MKEDDKKVLK